MSDENEDGDLITLQDKQVFTTGIRRKKITFVSSRNADAPESEPTKLGAGDRYLATVLGRDGGSGEGKEQQHFEGTSPAQTAPESGFSDRAICEICQLPVGPDAVGGDRTEYRPHEASLAHQTCLSPSHPPSHLDRERRGLKYLSSYGWDLDARQGLGATGQGIRAPIKPRPKNDTLGLGLVVAPHPEKIGKRPAMKLDAKKTRDAEAKGRDDRRRLRDLFYRSQDVEKYLGSHR
ncbi:MAG: hypothetical protein L6R39_006460 [Caloplaca ligustica]|nr:MAG: hypothetical protein L6R39_006460 [Caloplaca ligustica]